MLKLGMSVSAVVLAITLAGCSATSSENASTSKPTESVRSTTPSTTPTATPTPTPTPTKDVSANAVAAAIRSKVPTVTATTSLTAETDVNQLLGRPNGYSQATVLTDSRGDCPADGPGTDCGATIEVWGSQADAQARADYIQAILKQSTALGSEYDSVGGNVLLRVTGKLTPDQAKQYQDAFRGYIGG